MKDDELTKKLEKIKQKNIDVAPYKNKIKQKIEMRFQRAQRKRVIFRRLSFVSGILIALFFAILMPFIYGGSGEVSLIRSRDIIPKVITIEKKIKIINNVKQPFVYDKDTQTIWFIGETNNLYTVFCTNLSDGETDMLSPAVDNPTDVKGDIRISGSKVYAGIGDYLYIIDKNTKQVSVVQLSKEKYPINKSKSHPIKSILPISDNKIAISRSDATDIIFYNPFSSLSNSYRLPINMESPLKIIKGNNDEIYFIAKFINTEKRVVGMLSPHNRRIIIFKNIHPDDIFYCNGLFVEQSGELYKIDIKDKTFCKIELNTGNNSCFFSGENGIYIVPKTENKTSLKEYIPDTNTLLVFNKCDVEKENIKGLIQTNSAIFCIIYQNN